ncbi:SUKH-3 domain-containing protein [Plantactinospora sp. GCM10030261]|uniref:SUKH-3 domain-containing protein n=1 Tax=Plantactinospora sp. GCM10030261 TaxID=3273420 RepID=UPI00360F772F
MSERFNEPVEAALRAAGWFPGRRISDAEVARMREGFESGAGPLDARLTSFDVADSAIAEFGGLVIAGDPPGAELSPRPFAIDPTLAAHSMATLVDAGRAVNSALYPLGVEGLDEAVLAITEQGTVLAIDPIDDWLLGDTLDDALDLLITGRRPRPVSPDDLRTPRWLPPPADSPDGSTPGSRLRQPVCAAFHLPRTPFSPHHTWLSPTLTRMGIQITLDPDRPGEFRADSWGGVPCEVHVLDLPRHTVLVLAFERDAVGDEPLATPIGFDDMPEELKRILREMGPVSVEAGPLASAFHNACYGLTPALRLAYLCLKPRGELLRFVAEVDSALLSTDETALREEDFALVYLADGVGFELTGEQRDELPIDGGRLFLRPETTGRGGGDTP